EAGGLTSRELLEILRGLAGANLVGADVVEVAPPYDHAEITSIAASHVAYDLVSLLALRKNAPCPPPSPRPRPAAPTASPTPSAPPPPARCCGPPSAARTPSARPCWAPSPS